MRVEHDRERKTTGAATRIVYAVTLPTTARLFLNGQLRYLRSVGYDVTLVASPEPELTEVGEREGVRVVGIPMSRATGGPGDLIAIARLTDLFRRTKPHIVNGSTTKAGLLSMLAARVAGVPIRVYLLRGLRLETLTGLPRGVLSLTERAASNSATDVICVSKSLRDAYLSGGFCDPSKLRVLGDGSSNGVDIHRFDLTPERVARAREIRARLGIGPDSVCIGFMGRPVADKGMRELMEAFERLGQRDVALLVVGADLAGDELDPEFARWACSKSRVFCVSQVPNPEDYHAAFDILAFPSYREGFPNVPLEAAATGRPAVGFRVTGVRDAVVDGETGILAPPRDVAALAAALARYVDEPALRRAHGDKARARARTRFASEGVWRAWADEYARLSARAGLAPAQVPLPSV